MRSVGWMREVRAGRLLGLAAVALGLLAVTALASREPLSAIGKGGAGTGGFQINASPWEFALIGAGGGIGFIFLLVYGGFSRRTPAQGSLPSLLRRLAVLFAPVIVVLLILAGLDGLHRSAAPQRHGVGPAASFHLVPLRHAAFTVPAGVTGAILATLVAALLVLVVGASVRPRRHARQALPSAVESAVAAALVDLDTIDDPRLAIIAAYRSMEKALGAAGFPRAAPEAPREYLTRVATTLELDPKPLRTLTTLFEAAKFSLRQLDTTARLRAIAALRALQAELA